MELKILDKVAYKGGEVILGMEEGTDKFLSRYMPPIDNGTYIWHIMNVRDDVRLYIIQHHNGEKKSFFTDYSNIFGEVDVSKLEEDKNYIYVEAKDLVLMERDGVIYTNEEVLSPEESSTEVDIPSDNLEVDIPSDNLMPEGNFEEHEEIITEQPQVNNLNTPHYTRYECPQSVMMETVSIPKIIKSMKMTEPFTYEKASGEVGKGRAGDYLVLANEYIFREPKETFLDKYQHLGDSQTKNIDGITFVLDDKVHDYIQWLENQNTSLRDELYLIHPTANNVDK